MFVAIFSESQFRSLLEHQFALLFVKDSTNFFTQANGMSSPLLQPIEESAMHMQMQRLLSPIRHPISRRVMLLEKVPDGGEVLPFVLMFYGSPSSYFWEDEGGVTHSIAQDEGGEQGDPLMPLLFALGQHPALLATQRRLDPSEKVFAFLDDIYTKTEPSRVGVAYTTVQEELFNHCHIRVHTGKTQVWNQGGIRPEACDLLDRIAQQADPDAHVWKGAGLPEADQGLRVLWDTSWPPSLRGGPVGDSGGRTPGFPGQNPTPPRFAVRVVTVVALRISQGHILHEGSSSGVQFQVRSEAR